MFTPILCIFLEALQGLVMIVQFGLDIEERRFPEYITQPEPVEQYCGPKGLLHLLERHLGIRYPERQEYLRFEQYRQILEVHLQQHPAAFYAASFKADKIATAVALLERRDELLLNGWNFQLTADLPQRLRTWAELEALAYEGTPTVLHLGYAERYQRIRQAIGQAPLPLEKIYLTEPLALLPPHLRQLLQQLEQTGIALIHPTTPTPTLGTDLGHLQAALLQQDHPKHRVQADGSLLILRAKRETQAAEYVAKLIQLNPQWRPLCLIPNKNRALDNSLVEEGLPSMGIASESIARPTLQVLKLASTFLWKPIDPYKILEFVSLPNTPLDKRLARGIARLMAQKPGLFSGSWNAMVRDFYESLETQINAAPTTAEREEWQARKDKAQAQYRFWFVRRRYDSHEAVPKREVIELYRYVSQWAKDQEEETKQLIDSLQKSINKASTPHDKATLYQHHKEDLQNALPALEALRIQSGNLVQVLEALPESEASLPYLRLERLVRTVNEPAAVRFRSAELDHLPYVHHGGAVVRPAPEVLWWNFVQSEREAGFSKWYRPERAYLKKRGIHLETPQEENARLLWQRRQPVLQAQQRLILVWPDYIDGKAQLPHPLWGDLCAALGEGHLEALTLDLNEAKTAPLWEQCYTLPEQQSLPPTSLGQTPTHFQLPAATAWEPKVMESFSSLDLLLYYPYQWLFRHQVQLSRGTVWKIVEERRLEGNLAHRLFELLLTEVKGQEQDWTKAKVFTWVDDHTQDLLEREGAVLLMYGQEARRIGWVQKVRQAAWTLIYNLQQNNWRIRAIEHPVEGAVGAMQLRGVIDLVLEREHLGQTEYAIVDLKWRGKNHFLRKMANGEDLQLVIYSRLLDVPVTWVHTAYFIMGSETFVARNRRAFRSAQVTPDTEQSFQEVHQGIWDKIEATYHWRLEEVAAGRIEVRTEETLSELEEYLQEAIDFEQMLQLLEMKQESARYDDYRVLIQQLR